MGATAAPFFLLFASAAFAQPAGNDALPPPVRFSLGEFQALRWLEGTWRGGAPGGDPFYEGFRLSDDSTLVISYFADSTLTGTVGTASVVLRGGRIYHESGPGRWVATGLDEGGLHFAPLKGASNRFTWWRRSPDGWTATLVSPTGRTTVYDLRRVRDGSQAEAPVPAGGPAPVAPRPPLGSCPGAVDG